MDNNFDFTFTSEGKYQASDDEAAGASRPSNTGRRRRRSQGVTTEEQKRERNKEINRAFRQRRKEKENKTRQTLHFLREENTILVRENRSLMIERDSMSQNLQSAAMETQQLQSEILTLNRDIAAGQQSVDSYSNLLVATNTSNRAVELRKLEIENYILKQTDWVNWDTEKEQILQNMARLEVENKTLKLKHQALSELDHKH